MFKRGLFIVVAFFIFSLNTKPALSITIPAGGEGIFTFDFGDPDKSDFLISIYDETFMYNLAFSDGWNGTLSLHDDLNQEPLYSVTNNDPSTLLDYTMVFGKEAYPGLFDDQISYWKISPLTTVAVGDPDGGPMAAVFTGPLGYPGHAASGDLTVTSPVPIPGAVWLFGSGLLGLVGIGRRRFKK